MKAGSAGPVTGLHLELLPVALKFFGDQLPEASKNALAHFGATAEQCDFAVRIDTEPVIEDVGIDPGGFFVAEQCGDAEH